VESVDRHEIPSRYAIHIGGQTICLDRNDAARGISKADNFPPKLGGVPASLSKQAGWFQSGMLQEFGAGTTPPRCARHPS